MKYQVLEINRKEDIRLCPLFHIDQYNWSGEYRPKAYGRMGFLKGEGFYVEMTCEEKNPPVNHLEPGSRVYMDSAMEVFLCLRPQDKPQTYANFEMNAAGVLLAAYGSKCFPRPHFSKECQQQIQCRGHIGENSWNLSLYLPVTVFAEAYPGQPIRLEKGSRFTCNFFKLREEAGPDQHFASFAPIVSKTPMFHLPEFFAEAEII